MSEKKKHPGGAPRIIETAEELKSKIDEYFKSLEPKPVTAKNENGEEYLLTNKAGDPVMTKPRAPTVAGLALFLGYASRQSLYDIENRGEEFSYHKKRAVLAIETFHEEGLSDSNPVGHIYWTKNHGWKDKQDVDINGNLSVNIIDDIKGKK